MMNRRMLSLVLLVGLMLPACTWVELKPEAEKVRIGALEEVANCRKLASTTVMVKADVATFARNREKVRSELETLARNNAAHLKGNVVVPVTPIEDGSQSFVVYRCR